MSKNILISLGVTMFLIGFSLFMNWVSKFFIGKIISVVIMFLIIFVFVYLNVATNRKEGNHDERN